MSSWNVYKATAKERGALAMELYAVESTAIGTPEAVKETLPSHLAYQQELEKSGQLFLAGPLSDATGELMQGTGLIIYRAASLEAARALAEQDPMHLQGVRRFTIRRWLINEGFLPLTLSLSQRKIAFSQP